jgi:hypothetical protein
MPDMTTMFLVVAFVVIFYASYSAHKLKDQIWCTFRRRDKTRIEKWGKVKYGRIEFDGGWYYLNTKRTTIKMVTSGIHQIMPIWVRCLDFRFDSNQPLDPDNFNADYDNPNDRKALDKSEDLTALMVSQANSLGGNKKQGLLEKIFPIIVIAGFCILGYFVYSTMQKTDAVGYGMNVIQTQLEQIKSLSGNK